MSARKNTKGRDIESISSLGIMKNASFGKGDLKSARYFKGKSLEDEGYHTYGPKIPKKCTPCVWITR
jgi:hypothetical protein